MQVFYQTAKLKTIWWNVLLKKSSTNGWNSIGSDESAKSSWIEFFYSVNYCWHGMAIKGHELIFSLTYNCHYLKLYRIPKKLFILKHSKIHATKFRIATKIFFKCYFIELSLDFSMTISFFGKFFPILSFKKMVVFLICHKPTWI